MSILVKHQPVVQLQICADQFVLSKIDSNITLTKISKIYFPEKIFFKIWRKKHQSWRLEQMKLCYMQLTKKYSFCKNIQMISQKRYFSKYDAKSASCWDSRLGQMEMCYLKLATFLPSIPLLLFTLDNISELQTAITHKISTQTTIYCPRGNKSLLLFIKEIQSKMAKMNLPENWDAFQIVPWSYNKNPTKQAE